ncbi:30S ribosomal protein S11 [Candidatus Peregrinibacteria bacterium]|nr:30S ribosomal protein S11 [Candidatus Peregrinibacteria bacterium]
MAEEKKPTENKTKETKEKTKKGSSVKKEKAEKPQKKPKSRRRSVPEGNAHIHASYNNTIITLTEPNGDIVSWSSAGSSGFKGARKATPYAAQVSAENAVEKAKPYGLERVHVFIKGVGTGREQAVRGLVSAGLDLISISDITPIPHNGCRKKKLRRP